MLLMCTAVALLHSQYILLENLDYKQLIQACTIVHYNFCLMAVWGNKLSAGAHLCTHELYHSLEPRPSPKTRGWVKD